MAGIKNLFKATFYNFKKNSYYAQIRVEGAFVGPKSTLLNSKSDY